MVLSFISKLFKIIDFGEAKLGVGHEGTLRGTPRNLSPEANYEYLNGGEKLFNEYNPYKSDVYSIGLTLLYANFGYLPFPMKKNKMEEILFS